jgi:hypothetical protein
MMQETRLKFAGIGNSQIEYLATNLKDEKTDRIRKLLISSLVGRWTCSNLNGEYFSKFSCFSTIAIGT